MQDKEPLLSTTIDLSHASSTSMHPAATATAHIATTSPRSSSMVINSRTPASSSASSSRSSLSHEGNFVRVIERNVEYLKGQFEEVFASRSSQSLFVPVICGSIFFLYIINTIAWHMSSSPLSRDPLASRAVPGMGQVGEKGAKNEDEDPAFEPNLPQLVKLLTISPGSLLIPYNW